MSDFVYSEVLDGKDPKFGTSTIRLLSFATTENATDESPLQFVMHLAEVDNLEATDTKFDALPYTWGSGHTIQNIIINGHWFPMAENLEAALRQLKKQIPDREDNYSSRFWRNEGELWGSLWIYAICINERSNAEKSHQVGRTGL